MEIVHLTRELVRTCLWQSENREAGEQDYYYWTVEKKAEMEERAIQLNMPDYCVKRLLGWQKDPPPPFGPFAVPPTPPHAVPGEVVPDPPPPVTPLPEVDLGPVLEKLGELEGAVKELKTILEEGKDSWTRLTNAVLHDIDQLPPSYRGKILGYTITLSPVIDGSK
jgi:hypothetical protein